MVTRSGLPQCHMTQGSLMEAFNTPADWTITGDGSVALVDTEFGPGMKFTTTAVGTSCKFRKTVSLNFAGVEPYYGYWMYVNESANIGPTIDFYFCEDSACAKSHHRNLPTFLTQASLGRPYRINSGWNYIAIRSYTVAGSASAWSATQIRLNLSLTAISGTTLEITLLPAYYITKSAMPKVIFDFDNGIDSVYTTAYPILAAAGFRGSTGICSDFVGNSQGAYEGQTYNQMTEAQLDELYAAGWDINNHTKHHMNLSTLDYANNIIQIGDCQDWLLERYPRSARHLVFPNGGFTQAATIAAMRALDVLSGRTFVSTDVGYNNYHVTPIYSQETISMDSERWTLAQIYGYIDTAIATGSTISLCYHAIKDRLTTYDTTVADFQAVVDYLVSKGNAIEVITRSEYYETLFNPRYRSLPVTRA